MPIPRPDPTPNALLLELRRTESQLQAAEAVRELALSTLEEEHRATLEPLRKAHKTILAQLFQAVQQLPVGESQALTHGEIAHRALPPHVELDRPDEEMVSVLASAGIYGALVETRAINRQALARLPEAQLAELGVRLVSDRQLVVRLPNGSRFTREPS